MQPKKLLPLLTLITTLASTNVSANTVYPAIDAEVKTIEGLPTLCLDGKSVPPLLCVTADPSGKSSISNNTLHLRSKALYTGISKNTKKNLPANCTIEAEVAFDAYTGDDASIGFAFVRDAGTITFNLAAYKSGKRIKFWDRGASGKGLIRWDKPFDWEQGVFHRMQMQINGRQIRISINDKHIATEECPADSNPGPLLLNAYRAEGRIRNVRVINPDGTLFMQERFADPQQPLWHTRAGSDNNLLSKAAENGIHLCQVGFALPEFWKGADKFDLKLFSERMLAALEADPETYVIMRLRLPPPEFWKQANPDEIVRGKYLNGKDMPRQRWANFASSIWREDLQRVLTELVKRIDSQPWAGRLIGFQVMAADGGEWVYSFQRITFHDYSFAQQREFRGWLKNKYGSDARLRQAWGEKSATIAKTEIPAPAERIHHALWSELGSALPSKKNTRTNRIFIDPKRDKDLLDYKKFHNQAITEIILLAAQTLKSNSKQKRVIGIYYGYHVPTTGSITNKGHSDLTNILTSPLIDILACPLNYDQRDVGGTTLPQLAPASARANGKLFWIEDDSRTCYSREKIQWRVNSLPETEAVIKRTFAYALTKGGGDWWLDFGNHWFGHPPILKLFKCFAVTMKRATPSERTSNAQIVVLLNDKTYLRLLRNAQFTEAAVYRQLLEECSRIGAPFDIAMLSDLEKLPPYKLYMLPDAFYVSDKEQEMLKRNLRCKGRTTIWIYAPGFWTSEGFSERAASELTGINLKSSRISAEPDMRLTSAESAWTSTLPVTFRHISPVRLDPVIYADDPECIELGQMVMRTPKSSGGYKTSVRRRRTALAVKEFESWNSIYSALPCIPATLLRTLAKEAGVHLYGEGGDSIFSSQGFLAIHTASAGRKKLVLPPGVKVLHEIFDDSRVTLKANAAEINLPYGVTRIWRLEF